MRESLRAYFIFSRKERIGISLLLLIVMSVAVAPAFINGREIVSDSTMGAKYEGYFVALESIKDSGAKQRERYFSQTPVSAAEKDGSKALSPFYFDPNNLGVEGWQRLGVRDRTALSIDKYLNKGGRFRKPEDILKIYGLSDREKQQLLPFVRIGADAKRSGENNGVRSWPQTVSGLSDSSGVKPGAHFASRFEAGHRSSYTKSAAAEVEINDADTTAWRSLPGIGQVLSKRIVSFREKLGGFYNITQLTEVYGITDSTFNLIRPYLRCNATIVKLNLNEASETELERHPYFRKNVARAIIHFRSQHGRFQELSQLRQIVIITQDIYQRLLPYASL